MQRNLRDHGARYGLAGQAIDEREHAYVNAALGERGILAEFEVVADVGVGEVESPCQHPNGELGAAGLDGGFSVLVAQKVAVELERNAGRLRDAALERRIPARVLARVEVGEAIQQAIVGGRVIEQMGDSEVDTAAARERLAADIARNRIRIVLGLVGLMIVLAFLHIMGQVAREREYSRRQEQTRIAASCDDGIAHLGHS